MKAFTEENPGRLYVHQCPECKNWQIEYTDFVFTQDATFRVNSITGGWEVDLKHCHQMVEDVVEEHYRTEHPLAFAEFRINQR